MIRVVFFILAFIFMIAGVAIAVAVLVGGEPIESYLESLPAKRLVIIWLSANLCSAGALIVLYFFVPSDRMILYAAFCSMLGIFLFLGTVPFSGLFSSGWMVQFGDFSASFKPFENQAQLDPSSALAITALFLILIFRELRKTPPDQNAP
jgi:hypothetical protein